MNIKGIKLKGVSINTWDGLLDEKTITSGDLHIATKDGEAMFFHDSIDFSTYAGTDGGSTPYRLEFTDSAGKKASAYGGAAGGGDAFTTIYTSDFSAGLDFWVLTQGDETSSFAHDVNKAVLETTIAGTNEVRPYIRRGVDIVAVPDGRMAYIDLTYVVNSGNVYCQPRISLTTASPTVTLAGSGTISLDGRAAVSAAASISLFFDGRETFSLDITEILTKYRTDVPATGLHLMSAKNGTTRNMASVESGFNPNAIVGVKIYG